MNSIITWSPGMTLAQLERHVIKEAYRFYRENKTATANALGVAVNTLTAKLKQYEQEQEDENARKRDEENRRIDFLDRCRNGHAAVDARHAAALGAGDGAEAEAGVRTQSASPAAEKPAVSMSQRAKVQDVLPSKPAMGGNRRSG